MAKKKVIDVEAVVAGVDEDPSEKKVRDLGKVPLNEMAKALEEFNASPNAEDLIFKSMSADNRKKHGLSLSTAQLEERQMGSRQKMNDDRVDYAIASSRLVLRQAWREPDNNGKILSRVDYFESKLGDSWFTVDRHYKAVICLALMGKDASCLNLYKYRRLAAFFDKIEKNVATAKDFEELHGKLLEKPEKAADIQTDKEFENELKQRFGQREAEMKALTEGDEDKDPLVRKSFEIPASQERTVNEAHRLAMDIAKEENREAPGLGATIVEAMSHWMLQVNQGQKLMAAERARQLFQEAYGIALIPFKVHKFQTNPTLKEMPHIRIFQVGDYFMLEEEPRYVAKKLGVKVEQIKEVHLNVGAYLLRTGAMTIENEDIRKAEEVLTKSFEGVKKEPVAEEAKPKKAKAKKADKEEKKETAADAAEDQEDTPKKKKKKISELTDNEIAASITKIKSDLGMTEEEFKELSSGKEPVKVLRELVKMQKSSA